MLYHLYEFGHAAFAPWRAAARMGAMALTSPLSPVGDAPYAKNLSAAVGMMDSLTRRRPKPDWRIPHIVEGGRARRVTIDVTRRRAFARLLHFRTPEVETEKPTVLIVPPMSGHYATLLRGTVEAMLKAHDVYVVDWTNARDVPFVFGRFDLDSFVDYVRDFLIDIGGRAHVMAVCQPGPPVLTAASLMAEDGHENRPASLVIMGSPIDARRSPTVPNKLAEERPLSWFEDNLVQIVPPPYPGMGRRVYPGFLQLQSFMAMNVDRHVDAHWRYFEHLVEGDQDSADKHEEFYDEYLAVMDMTAEFYLQTLADVFQEHKLARGLATVHGRRVKPEAIVDIALMTVEGEKDDISGVGQTQAAHDLCVNIPEELKIDHVQEGVGHYGVFNGRRWRESIQPKIAAFIAEAEKRLVRPTRRAA